MNMVKGQALSCYRGGRVVFSKLDFKVGAGKILRLTGPNGSGKSSLLRIIAGLLNPFAGQIHRSEDFIFLDQRQSIKPRLTVFENLKFWASLQRPVNVNDALDCWQLTKLKDLPAGFLSLGQKKRLQLCQLCLKPAPLWLLDEPMLGLDDKGVQQFTHLLRQHSDKDGITILATHEAIDGSNDLAVN